MITEDDVEGLLASLVAIPSINPRDAQNFEPPLGEAGLGEFVTCWLERHGVDVSTHEVLPGRSNILAVVPGRTLDVLVLEAHLDTVETDGMSDPFNPEVRDGRMYGRGTCDTKGALAAFMLVLAELVDGPTPSVSVALAGTVDEEHHYRGVVALLDWLEGQNRRCIGAVVGEPTQLALGTAHRGVVRFTVHVHGRAGHTSTPHDAVNAIGLASRAVSCIEDMYASTVHHSLLGGATRTVTRISGGDGPNIVPATCSFDVDRRTLPGEDPHQAWRATVQELKALLGPTTVTAEDPHTIDYPLDTSQTSRLVRTVQSALRAHGRPDTACGLPFGTDASKFQLRGIDAVVLGPGSIREAHTVNESVDLIEVLQMAEIVLNIARADTWATSRAGQ